MTDLPRVAPPNLSEDALSVSPAPAVPFSYGHADALIGVGASDSREAQLPGTVSEKSGFFPGGGVAVPGDRYHSPLHPPAELAANDDGLDPARLINALWRSPDAVHQLAFRQPPSGIFKPQIVTDVTRAIHEASRLDADGHEVYFACAEYRSADSRKAENTVGARAFWLDIDCGPQKAEAGKGYAELGVAKNALATFCRKTELPEPTHLVASGGGLHPYWALDRLLPTELWKQIAGRLKKLCTAHGFLADSSRTGDIASILRVPGTSNRKESNARPVKLLKANDDYIDAEDFARLVGEAVDRIQASSMAPVRPLPVTHNDGDRSYFFDRDRLASALNFIDPDGDDETWKLKVIAPMARGAARQPEHADALKALAREWSSGELRGAPSIKWSSPGSNGKTGEEVFDAEWGRFLNDGYAGKHTTLGTLFYLAKQSGWSSPIDAFDVVEDTVVVDPMSAVPGVLDSVLSRVLDGDVGAPLEDPSVDAMVALKAHSLPAFHRYRQKLKQANNKVSLAAIDDVVSERSDTSTPAETHHGYAKVLLNELTVQGHAPVANSGALHVLDPKTILWSPFDTDKVARLVAERSDGLDNCKRRSDYQGIAQHACSMASDPDFFDRAAIGIACPEGFIRVDGDGIRIEPLTPEHRQRHRLAFSPQDRLTPMFDQFLHETFHSPVEGEEFDQVRLAQEIAGAIMLRLMARFHKAVLLFDPFGRAGKGTFMSLCEQLVPRSNATAISPFKWSSEYYVAGLAGSLLNVVGELPDGEPIPSAVFKSVIGKDRITGRNPAGRPFSFKNEAAHVFMSNHMINTRDHTEAFYARWMMLEFPNSRLKLGLTLDAGLAERIIATEMPGIAYWALEGARRVLRNGGFSTSRVHDRLIAKWRRSASSVEEFIHEECERAEGPDASVKRSEFYTRYRTWCGENGRKPYSKAHVKELLENNLTLGVKLASLNGYEIFRGLVFKGPSKGDIVSL